MFPNCYFDLLSLDAGRFEPFVDAGLHYPGTHMHGIAPGLDHSN